MKTLQDAIAEMNAASTAWMAEAPGRWTGLLTDNMAHWTAMDITTPDELHDYLDAQTVNATSAADTAYWEMEEFMADMENQEKIWAEETREAGILAALAAGAPNRATAERWMEMA